MMLVCVRVCGRVCRVARATSPHTSSKSDWDEPDTHADRWGAPQPAGLPKKGDLPSFFTRVFFTLAFWDPGEEISRNIA